MTYLTLDEAAAKAQVCRNTLAGWIKEGLPVMEFSPRLKRIREDQFDAWIERKCAGTPSSQALSGARNSKTEVIEKTVKVGR